MENTIFTILILVAITGWMVGIVYFFSKLDNRNKLDSRDPINIKKRLIWFGRGVTALITVSIFCTVMYRSIKFAWLTGILLFLFIILPRIYIFVRKSGKFGRNQIIKSDWDPKAYAEEMKKSSSPVSAFFLIDSLGAISKCVKWLTYLNQFNMPNMKESQYFTDVSEIYKSGKEVMNFDHSFKLLWKNERFSGLLRCHFVEKGKYEIELWLPGVIANEVVDKFSDGREGFFCGFMPPQFYD